MERFFRILLIIISVIYRLTNQADNHEYRIFGGKLAKKRQFTYYAHLEIPTYSSNPQRTGQVTHCGGSLIHKEWILTAARCFASTNLTKLENQRPKSIYMSFFILHHGNPAMNAFKHVIVHPNFTFQRKKGKPIIRNDLALVELVRPYIFTQFVSLVFLPPEKELIKIRRCNNGFIVGTGKDEFTINRYRIYAPVKIADKPFKYLIDKSPTAFYALSKLLKGHPSYGDFGGPYICYPAPKNISVQYGIISGVYEYRSRIIGIFEDIDKHMDFIVDIVPLREYGEYEEVYQDQEGEIRIQIQKSDILNNNGQNVRVVKVLTLFFLGAYIKGYNKLLY